MPLQEAETWDTQVLHGGSANYANLVQSSEDPYPITCYRSAWNGHPAFPSIADDFSSANLRFSALHIRVVRLQIHMPRRLQRVEIQTTQHDGLFRPLHVHVERDEFRVPGVAVRGLHLVVRASERLRDRSKHNQAVLLRCRRRLLDHLLGVRQRRQHFHLQQRQLHMVLPEEQVRSYSEKPGGGEERKRS